MSTFLCAACGKTVRIIKGDTEMRLEPHKGDEGETRPTSNVLVIDG
ncbi:hypothetical protein [Nocardia sp. NPDC051570]